LFESKNLQFHLIETFKKPIKKTSCASSSKTLKEPPVFTRESAKRTNSFIAGYLMGSQIFENCGYTSDSVLRF